jgi:hypothetical protein
MIERTDAEVHQRLRGVVLVEVVEAEEGLDRPVRIAKESDAEEGDRQLNRGARRIIEAEGQSAIESELDGAAVVNSMVAASAANRRTGVRMRTTP